MIRLSSFADGIKDDADRFDDNVDGRLLQSRDKNDSLVADLTTKLLVILRNMFTEKGIDLKLPIANAKRPTNIVFNAEVKRLIRLVHAMIKSLEDLLHHIEGNYQRPLETEELWGSIQANKVPTDWMAVSFMTACKTFADFVLEVILRVKFW